MKKIIDIEDVENYRKSYTSKIVVAACGCFDIVHIGHIEYLVGAKQFGDVLFVGVNSNYSIIQNKEKEPIFSTEDRLRLIAALDCVDYVFSFPHKTFDDSLIRINPQFFARGVDAIQKGFPEQDTVKRLNINVISIGDVKRASSRSLRKYFE